MTLTDTLSGRSKRRKVARESALINGQQDSRGTALYHCNYCERDISRTVRIKCATCQDFDLCLDCFSVGVEVTPHKSDHDYRVVDNLSFPLFHPDWGADEELLLLEAIEMFGLGNWGAVAEHMGPSKTADMCRLHWYQIFVDSPEYPLPSPAPEMRDVDLAKLVQEAKNKAKASSKAAPAVEVPRRKRGRPPSNPAAQHTAEDKNVAEASPHGSPVPDSAAGAAASGTEAGQEPPDTPEAHPDGAAGEHAGESAGRGRKRPRHATGAAAARGEEESSPAPARMQVSGRTMHQASPPPGAAAPTGEETEGKVPAAVGGKAAPVTGAVAGQAKVGSDTYSLTGYNQKRNEFDPEFDNDAELLIADLEFHEDDTEEEKADKLHMLEIYNKRLDERERRRDFILHHQLLNIRRTQAQEKRRSGLEKEIHASLRVLARYQGNPEAQEALVESLMVERRLRQRIHELKECRRHGIRTLSEADTHLEEHRKKMAADHMALSSAASAELLRIPVAAPVRGQPTQMVIPEHGLPTAWAPVLTGRSGVAALDSWRLRRGFSLDLRCLPGTQLLSNRERELCARSRILPPHYLLIKDSLIRDCLENGQLSRMEVRDFFRLDGSKATKIYDLLVSCGWINSGLTRAKDQPAATPSTSIAGGSTVRGEEETEWNATQQAAGKHQGANSEGEVQQQRWPGIKVDSH